ncbi:MAG: glycosyl hydrolase [Bacteroidales bacterium]
MNLKSRMLILFCCLAVGFLSAQQISWTGNIDKISIFNSSNWLDEATGNALTTAISSSVAINRDVYFGSKATIGTDQEVKGLFDAGTGKITFKKANVKTDYVTVSGFNSATSITLDSSIVLTGKVTAPLITLSGNSQLHLYESDALGAGTKINFVGQNAWLYFHSLTPQQVVDKYSAQITLDGIAAIVSSNVRVVQYYGGTVVIPQNASYKAMYLYSGLNLTGVSKYFRVSYSTGTNIGANSTNKAASMFLKKGYMATIAQNQDGTGPCKIYIAEDSDIVVNGKINGKNDTVMFVRVAPWRWISKKGIGGNFPDFNTGWLYNWGANLSSTIEKEYVPMQWGTWGLDDNAVSLRTKPDVTNELGFNEPDGTGQANMSITQCLSNWPKLMVTGLRLGSPAFVRVDSLYKFMDRALALGYRVDYMCLHSYEKRTGDNYVNTIYKPLYDKYKIPLWITEFNYGASWNVTANESMLSLYNGQKDFVTKMNAAPFIERYALFAWSNPVNMVDTLCYSFEKYDAAAVGGTSSTTLSARGIFYREFESLPSRGNPLIYRTKISKAKQTAAALANTVTYDMHYFSFVSRNTDGTNRRRIQISTTAGKINTAFMGGISTTTAPTNEVFFMTKKSGNIYKLKVNSNSLTLSVRNDSVVVEVESQSDNQLWEMVAITGTNYFALKNVASGKYINPMGNNITVGTLLTSLSSSDITLNKSAQWEPIAGADPTLGVFDMSVGPLSGNAPLTVNLMGAKKTLENNDAFYRWYMFQGTDTLVSTNYQDQITYTKPGSYRIQARGRDYISRTTYKEYTVIVNDPLAVPIVSSSLVRIFPNPVRSEFQLAGVEEGKLVSLYDIRGKLVLQCIYTGNSIKTNQLSSGFYILKCDGYTPLKLIKK